MSKKRSHGASPSKTRSPRASSSHTDAPVKKAIKPKETEKAIKAGASRPQSAADREPAQDLSLRVGEFPIVGIGASAGGLEAFTQLLEHLPPDTGMAFVLIQHLDPKHESMLKSLLTKATRMPIDEVKNGSLVKPNQVYIMPHNVSMSISQGVLMLTPRVESRGQNMPIDCFFRSLAQDQESQAIGVILSGTASDGAMGLEAIKAEGGITLAQDEKSAKYSGMPRSAAATGCVDFVAPPEEIARQLTHIGHHPYVVQSMGEKTPPLLARSENGLREIFVLLGVSTGVDFTYYKQTTIKRRIARRMALHKMERLEDYVKFLQNNSAEVAALYQDILIKVTNFFRDPETFEALKESVFPLLLKNRPPDAPIRLWVPGCSTGEEAYSLAIVLLEFLGDMAPALPIQIFATDINEAALDKARLGTYIENIALDVSPERLRRFFIKVNRGYQISKSIRDMCVFARQNVAKDPPFSRIDLISCRNVLIYLSAVLQKKVIPIFHYALKQNGFLLLGNSETISAFSDLFDLVDKKNKIYDKKMTPARLSFDFTSNNYVAQAEKIGAPQRIEEDTWSGVDVQKEADRVVLSRYAPAGVVVNDEMEILQFRGHTSAYLEPAPGKASLNLLKMVREGLLVELSAAIHQVRKTGTPARSEGVPLKYDDRARTINLEVIPIKAFPASQDRYYLVLFEEKTPQPAPPKKRAADRRDKVEPRADRNQITQLKQELAATKEYLQLIIEEQEATNEELKSANEEILSSNEELQSTNEEMETAKEELQSTNEELTTLNEELQNRNLEMSQINNDLNNLLSSVNIPIVMLGNDLRIRRFTPVAEKTLNLIPGDVGRPISDIQNNFDVPDLEALTLEVIDSVTIKEREVQGREGHWYSLRIRPYRTLENKIDGAVLMLVDIDALKRGDMEHERESHEKEILLKEIHHRIKNNLQIISSMLSLQSGQVRDREAIALFNESRNRIKSMALIHEILYRSQDLAKIDFADYIRNLTVHLAQAQGVGDDKVRIHIEASNVALNIDTAVPCGLLISELVSNALRHAFPGDRKGDLFIELRQNEKNHQHTLTVRDNGIGLPPDLDIKRTESLGLQLVTTLTQQIQGTIALRRNGGTEFKITFPE